MVTVPKWRRYLRFWRPDPEGDVDDELRTHLELRIAELRRGGLAAADAERQALEEFGDVETTRRRLYEIGHRRARRHARFLWWDALRDDLRFTSRALRRRPGFVLAVVTTLALGIGANATMFGIVDRLLLRPPPHVAAPEMLRHVFEHAPPSRGGASRVGGFSLDVVRELTAALHGLADVGAIATRPSPFGAGNMTLGVSEGARPVRGAVVTGSYLPLLGVRPLLGRVLLPADDTLPGAAPAAVIGHALWREEFGGSASVLGATIHVDGAAYTVAGVLPPDFRGVEHVVPDVWLPLGPVMAAEVARPDAAGRRGEPRLFVMARPAPGAPLALVRDRASAVLADVAARAPASARRTGPPTAELAPLRSLAAERMRLGDTRVSLLVAGVSVLLLLVACASVANLLLARALERSRELAVRLALGVSRRRLALQLLAESVLLALLGGLAALGVVQWGGALLQALLLGAVGVTERPVDVRVLAFTASVALLTGALVGLLPALQASRPSLTGALRRGVEEGGGRRAPTRVVLAGVQTALCVVLLLGTALFVRSLRQVEAIPLGFDAERVVAGMYDFESVGYERERVDAIFAQVTERAATTPGVLSVAESFGVPLQMAAFIPVFADGDAGRERPAMPVVYRVTPSYLATLGVQVLRGRGLLETDHDRAPKVVVVSQSMADAYWPGENALGRCLRVGADTMPCATVVGIAADVTPINVTAQLTRAQFYVPLAQSPGRLVPRAVVVSVAPDADPRTVSAALRGLMHGAAPELPFTDVAPLATMLDRELRQWRLGASVFALFGTIALVVAAVGLYGVLAFGVAQRRHEIGVRLALGATPSRILTLVVRQGVVVAGVGAAVGLLLALGSGRFVADLLYRTSPSDPTAVATVVATVMIVAVVASLVPAWRASRVAPADSMRAE